MSYSQVPNTSSPQTPLTNLSQVVDYVKLVSADLAQTEQIVANLDQEASLNFTTLVDKLTTLSDSVDALIKAFGTFANNTTKSFENISADMQMLLNREIIQWKWKSATRKIGAYELLTPPDTLLYVSPTCKIHIRDNFFIVPQQDPPKLYRFTFTGTIVGANGGTFIRWVDNNTNALSSVSFNAQANGVISAAATISNECLAPSGAILALQIAAQAAFIPADQGMVTIQQM